MSDGQTEAKPRQSAVRTVIVLVTRILFPFEGRAQAALRPRQRYPPIGEPDARVAVNLRRPGELLHPQREPQEVLDEFKRSMGSLDFAAQYQQEPVAEGGNLIKWKWFACYIGIRLVRVRG